MPTGGSGSPFFAGDKGKRPPENGRAGDAGGYSLWSSSHSFSAVGCQQAA